MKKKFCLFIIGIICILVTACSNSSNPGQLAGTWQMAGLMPITITFRNGETETLGIIEKVSYKSDGNDVLVTYLDGIAKGTTMRYTITGTNTARSGMGQLTRVR